MPFTETARVPLSGIDAQQVRNDHIAGLPEEFEVVNSLTFEIRRFGFTRRMVALGVTAVDSAKGTFGVVGMNPLGMRLFEVTGDENSARCVFALPELTRRGDVPGAIARDIRKVYYKRSPAPDAKVDIGESEVVFLQHEGDGVLEYVFGGAEADLLEKRYREDGALKWAVWFYEYSMKNDKRVPKGIIVHSFEHRYRLILRLKEIRF